MACRWSLAGAALAAACALAFAENAEWPQWRGPNRDGVSTETGWLTAWPQDGPKALWKTTVGTGLATVAIRNGRLYTLGNKDGNDTVYCLNPETGAELWKHSYPCKLTFSYPGPAATPTLDGSFAYTHSREGDLYCLDAEQGRVIWSRNVRKDFGLPPQQPDYGNSCSPLVVGKLLVVEVGGRDGIVVALDKASGALVWKGVEGGQLAYSSPVAFQLDGRRLVAVFHALGLGVLDPANGKELWRFPWKTHDRCSVATPIVADDRIFISSSYGQGCALLDARDGKPAYQNKNMMSHHGTCVLWRGYLYGFHGDWRQAGVLRCLDFKTGEEKWSKDGLGKGTLMIADGKLIVLSERGELMVAEASPQGFEPVSRAKVLTGLCWTVPVLCNGRVYCRNHQPGDLVCLDVSGAKHALSGAEGRDSRQAASPPVR